MAIDRMRNMCAKVALESDCTHILFLDDDVMVQPGTIESLIETDLDIVMAHTYIRGYPYHPMSFKRKEGPTGRYDLEHFDDVIEKSEKGVARCEAVGFSCCLIKTWLFKELDPPYFVTTPNSTEDVYFCLRCKNDIQGSMIVDEAGNWHPEGKEVKIGVDLRVPTGHLLDRQPVSMFNVDTLKRIHEETDGANKDKIKEVEAEKSNRANNYLKEVEALQ
jgi:hypothetical protein